MTREKALYRVAVARLDGEKHPYMFWVTHRRRFFHACSASYRKGNGDQKFTVKEGAVMSLRGFEEFYGFFTEHCTEKEIFAKFKLRKSCSDKKMRKFLPAEQTILLFENFMSCMGANYDNCDQMVAFYRINGCKGHNNHCAAKWKLLHMGLKKKINDVFYDSLSTQASYDRLIITEYRKKPKLFEELVDQETNFETCSDFDAGDYLVPPSASKKSEELPDLAAGEERILPGQKSRRS